MREFSEAVGKPAVGKMITRALTEAESYGITAPEGIGNFVVGFMHGMWADDAEERANEFLTRGSRPATNVQA